MSSGCGLYTPGNAIAAEILEEVEEIAGEVSEIDRHVHNLERWWGVIQGADETNAIHHGLDPFKPVSGNNTWGAAIPICGTADNPVLAGQTEFDAHRLLVVSLDDETDPWRVRIIYGTGTVEAAIAAEQWTEVMVIANAVPGNRAGGVPVDVRMIPVPIGTKLWAQAWSDTLSEVLHFFWGAHGYPAPTFP
jgi:hypothetical protein